MSSKNRGIIIACILLLIATVTSACEQPYSTPPAVTNTPNNFFATALTEPDSMKDVENFSTQTALAASGTLVPVIATQTPGSGAPQPAVTATNTPMIQLIPTATATQAVVAASPTNQVSQPPSGPRPGTYILKVGEFPFCIARRFNVDPDELLALSGLTNADTNSLSAGTVLTIPQSGSFPGDRSWHDHPATFTVGVTYDADTVYGVACYYGDIEPSVIAQNNGISVDATLTAGQTLNIP